MHHIGNQPSLPPERWLQTSPTTDMKPSHPTLRGTAVAAAAAVMITMTAHSAPKQSAPTPSAEPTPTVKQGMFGKVKSALSFKKKNDVSPLEVKLGENAKPLAVKKVAPPVKTKPEAATRSAAAEKTEPGKKGFIKKLFTKSDKAASAEPKLANAKTAKPSPVKEVKPEVKLAQQGDVEPEKKRGLFGFLRGGGKKSWDDEDAAEIHSFEKIVRPTDWQEHRVVEENEIAIYSFGPSQAQGPDDRLSRGTLVKVKKVTKGWALVEVHGGVTGYMDALMLRETVKDDFADPPPPVMASLSLESWAPAPPPPDLPDQPGAMDNDGALLLLPPLELEPKP